MKEKRDEGQKDSHVEMDKVLSRFEDDADFFKEMFANLLSYIPELSEKIRAAAEAGDGGTVKIAGHNLKGAAATMGARKASSLGALIEQRGRDGDFSDIPDILRDLDSELEVLKEYYSGL